MLLAILALSGCGGKDAPIEEVGPVIVPVEAEVVTITAVPAPSSTSYLSPAATATESAEPTSTEVAEASQPPSPTAELRRVSFAVIGDYGTTGVGTQEVAALVDGWDPDIVLTVGDNNYPDGAAGTIGGNITEHYGRFIAEDRFYPTLGNHDMTTDFGRPYLEYFELPGNERYYDFVRGDVHFFALNSDWREVDGIGAGSRQAEWLREGLAASEATWQVVYFHAAPYVSMEAKQGEGLRWPFAQWGADLVLVGHAHLYERLQIDGIPYVVNGLGGGGIYAFDEQVVPSSVFRFNGDFGAVLVEATAESLTLQFVTRTKRVIDQVTIFPAG